MKKTTLILLTLFLAASAVWADFKVETELRMSSYWALHADRDFSYKFDDNDDGNTGFKITGFIGENVKLSMNLTADGKYDAAGGYTALSLGNIFLEAELWKNALASNNKKLNDLLSIKLLGGIKSFEPSNDYGFAPNIKYGGKGFSLASVGTETNLGLSAVVALSTQGLGQFTGTFGFLADLGAGGSAA